MQMVNAFLIRFFAALMGNVFIQLLLIAVCADMVFGSLRAAKYRKWNSAVGIDGAIRKAGMLACVLLFTAIDMMMHVDVLGWLPADLRSTLDACGVVKMGITELFALLFILYEATSVLKNMLLCGLPVPAGMRKKLASWLDSMTDEIGHEQGAAGGNSVIAIGDMVDADGAQSDVFTDIRVEGFLKTDQNE